MIIKNLDIHNFRIFPQKNFFFHKHLNFIYGDNGSGKTSILEAIYFILVGRSFRTVSFKNIIQENITSFKLHSVFIKNNNENNISCMRSKDGQSILKWNGLRQNRHAYITQNFPVQLFSPETLQSLTRGARERCKLIDWGVFYNCKDFLPSWYKAKRLIKNRNIALRNKYPKSYVDILNKELSDISLVIDDQRKQYFDALIPEIQTILSDFNQNLSNIDYLYYKGWPTDKDLLELLDRNYSSDLKFGITSYGPHRADYIFKIKGLPIQDILSRGQQKILVCAVKIAQKILLFKNSNDHCLCLVDDLYSELDQHSLKTLFDNLSKSKSQIILTALDRHMLDFLFDENDYFEYDISSG